MVGERRMANTNANMFSPDERVDVGFDEATVVSSKYKTKRNHFRCKINYVTIDVK